MKNDHLTEMLGKQKFLFQQCISIEKLRKIYQNDFSTIYQLFLNNRIKHGRKSI